MKLETVFEKFDQLADAPNAVAKMRELVRQLAVTGRLVSQHNQDEPALALLDKIAAHKAALTKNGKLRGVKSFSPVLPDEASRALPQSWIWVRFGEIVVNRDGERIPVSKEDRTAKSKIYDYYGASGVIDKIDGYLFDKPLLLVGEDGANLINRSTPIAFMARGKYWVNNHAHVLDGISEDFLRYIELYINSISLEPYVTGSAQPKMNQAKMNSIPIALPPLGEQRRIVAKVDQLMTLIGQLESQLHESQTLHAALTRAALARFGEAPTPANLNFVFHDSYTIDPADLRKTILSLAIQGKLVPQDPNDEPGHLLLQRVLSDLSGKKSAKSFDDGSDSAELSFELPVGWSAARLGSILQPKRGISYGIIKLGPEPQHAGVSVLRCSNVRFRRLDLDGVRKVTKELSKQYGRTILDGGEVLINVRGTLGGCAVVPRSLQGFNIAREVAVIPVHAEIDAMFLLNVIASPYFQDRVVENLRGIAYEGLNLGLLRSFPIPIPPLGEQRRIVAKVDHLLALLDQLEGQLAASRATATSLMAAVVAELTARV